MTAAVLQLIRDECAACESCGGAVSGRLADGQNLPCGCFARVTFCHCQCSSDPSEADRFEALVSPGRTLSEVEADRLIRMADEWRPGRVAWILFAGALTLVFCGLQTLDLIK